MGKVRIWNPRTQPATAQGARQPNPKSGNGNAATARSIAKAVGTQGATPVPSGNGTTTNPTVSTLLDLQQQNFELQRQNDDYQDKLDRIADLASCDDPDEDFDDLAGKLNDILDLAAADDVEDLDDDDSDDNQDDD